MINLIKPISSLTQNLIKNISKVHRIDEDLIVLVFNGYSGSNLSPIIEQIKNGELSKYKIKVLKEETTKKSSNFEKIKFMWKKFSLLSKAKLVITTHGPMKIKKKTVNLELWHGFPLKGINLMDGNVRVKNNLNSIDFSISLSQTYSTLLNSCLGIDGDKYKITGYPRNDYLIKSNGRKVLSKILNYDLTNKKVILYMPTYRKTKNNRKEDGNKNYNNIFGYDYFEAEKFNSFLELNNFIFVFKLHPNEEELFKDTFDYKYENIKLITGSMLAEHNTDLYEIVNAANLLITDFSSIYLDYLLLDRPIIFYSSRFRII